MLGRCLGVGMKSLVVWALRQGEYEIGSEPLMRPLTTALQLKRGAGSPTIAREAELIMLKRSMISWWLQSNEP